LVGFELDLLELVLGRQSLLLGSHFRFDRFVEDLRKLKEQAKPGAWGDV